MEDEEKLEPEATNESEGVAAIADELVSEQPTPTPGADVKAAADHEAQKEPRDKNGATFDPEIHQSNPDGTPKLTTKGKLSLKPGNRRKTSTNSAPTASRPSSQSYVPPIGGSGPAPPPQPDQGPDFRQIAQLTVDNELAVMAIAMGSGWRAEATEREALIDAWESYYREKGITEVSPLTMLLMVHSGYAAKRLMAPDDETKTRYQAVKLWGANFVHKMRKKNRGARADHRDDGKRKDDAGEATGEPVPAAGASVSRL